MPAPTFSNLAGSGASAATSFNTASVSPTANRLILVTIHAYISTGSTQPATPTVTGNGITYASVVEAATDNSGTDQGRIFVFRGMAASPSAGAITISFGAVTMTRCQWSVDQSDANVETGGTNGSSAIVQSTGASSASGATSLSINYPTAMTSGNSGFSAFGHQQTEAKTPRAGWTELADVTTVSLASVETQYIAGTDTAGSASWTTGSRSGGVIIEIAAAGGGGGGSFTGTASLTATATITAGDQPPITLGGFGTAASGTTSAAPSYPGSEAANNLVLCHVASKPYADPPTFVELNPIGFARSGTVASGSGTGSVNSSVGARIAEGAIGGAETIVLDHGTVGDPILAVMSRWIIAAGKQWSYMVSAGVDTDETGTSVSATGGVFSVQPDDVIVVGVAIKDDGVTHTSQSVTMSGVTLSSMTWQGQYTTATANQASLYVGYCRVQSGTATGTPVYAATSSVSGASAVAVTFMRLRSQDPALPGVLGLYGDPLVEPESHTHNIPVLDGNNNRYRVGESNLAHDTNRVAVHKSADGGKTWKAVDWLNHPSAQDLEGTWTAKGQADPTTLYFWHTRDDTVWLIPFRMSTHATNPDTYGTMETVDSGLSVSGVTQYISAAELSDGTWWIAYSDTLAGANNQVAYRKRTATNTYGTKTTLSDGTGLNLTAPVLVRGASDVCYLFYKDNTTSNTLKYRTLTAGGTLSGASTVTSGISTQELAHTNAIYYNDNGTEVIGIAYTNTSGILKYREIRGGVLQSEETISTAAVTENPGSTDSRAAVAHLAVDGTTVHAMWFRAADGDLLRDSRVSGSWGTDTVVWDSGGETGWYVYCNVVTEGTQVKLVYTYDQGVHIDDGSNITYNEVVLRTTAAEAPSFITRPLVGPYPRLLRTGLLAPLQLRGDQTPAVPSGFNGTAALAVIETTTATGTAQGAASLTTTATITAAGVVATSSTASLTVTAATTTNGQAQGTASLTETATITAANQPVGAASLTATAAITADGLVGVVADPNQALPQIPAFFIRPDLASIQLAGDATTPAAQPTGDASLTATAAITAAGTTQGTASLTETASIAASSSGNFTGTASLTVTATSTAAGQTQGTASLTETVVVTASATGNLFGVVSHTETATITAVGNMSATGTTSQTVTATITAAGQVTGTATRTTTATITANGQPQGSATRTTTATITTTGNMSAAGIASQAIVATVTATGNVQTGGAATSTITAAITASGALVLLYEGTVTGGRLASGSIAGGKSDGNGRVTGEILTDSTGLRPHSGLRPSDGLHPTTPTAGARTTGGRR